MDREQRNRLTRTLSTALITSTALAGVVSAAEYTDYTVEQGDNLYRLAIEFNTTVDEIVAANGIANKNFIRTNQYLSIPTNTKVDNSSSSSNTGSSSTGTGSSSGTGGYYTVQRNDTLSGIALKYNTTVNQLATWNGIEDIHFIRTGAVLQVGSGGSSSSGSSSNGSSGSYSYSTQLSSNYMDHYSGGYYTVQRNDNLTKISNSFDVEIWELAQWNNISNIHLIREGASMMVNPSAAGTGSSSSTGSSSALASNEYRVVAGDNLYRLAIRFDTTVDQLAEWNNIQNVRLIYVGDVLKVAATGTTSSSASTNTAGATTETVTPTVTTPEVVTPTTPDTTVPEVNLAPEVNLTPDATTPSVTTPEVNLTPDVTTPSTPDAVSPSDPTLTTPDIVNPSDPTVSTPDIVSPSDPTVTLPAEVPDSTTSTPVTGEVSGDIMGDLESLFNQRSMPESIHQEYQAFLEDSQSVDTMAREVVMEIQIETAPEPSEEELAQQAAEEVAQKEAEERAAKQYVVSETTSVFNLAALFNASVGDLMTWNVIEDANVIPAGTVLQISA